MVYQYHLYEVDESQSRRIFKNIGFIPHVTAVPHTQIPDWYTRKRYLPIENNMMIAVILNFKNSITHRTLTVFIETFNLIN